EGRHDRARRLALPGGVHGDRRRRLARVHDRAQPQGRDRDLVRAQRDPHDRAAAPVAVSEPAGWQVYVLVSARGDRTYVGVTLDVARRLEQHNGGRPGGARSTRAGRPWQVGALHGPYATRGEALRV